MYIRPHLDDCDIIYHIPPLSNQFCSSITLHSLMESIERIQYQAALFITGTWKGTNRNKLYDDLGWESLSDRRWYRRLIQMFKIHNGLTPCYLNENLPPKRRLLYANNNPKVDQVIRPDLKIVFFPDSIRAWNNLGHKFHSYTSLSTFKSQILTFIRPEPKLTFNINDRQGLKHIFQLRVGLSLLKSHKKSHNFIDTPSDWCECNSDPENTYHYLLQCHLFHFPRIEPINSITSIVSPYNLIDVIDNQVIYL